MTMLVIGSSAQVNIWEGTRVKKRVLLTPYIPAKRLAPAKTVIVCPGGSYFWHDTETEGHDVARWLQQNGMAAFVLSKYEFPGSRLFFMLATTFLMFASGVVTDIPNYLILSRLGMVDTYWALILPAFAAPIGLFLMKQFMDGLPTALIEAATIDGASRFRVFWSIVMPNVKPAWLTMIIFSVQSLWNNNGSTLIYSEAKKPIVYALQQIQGGAVVNIARTGQMAAANVIIVAVPVLIFIFSQSRILETMASSGIKD